MIFLQDKYSPTKVFGDSWSVPRKVIFFPRETSPEGALPATPILEKGVCAAVRHMAAPAPLHHPALWSAVISGWTEDASQLITDGANTEERGGYAPRLTTPLQVALQLGQVEVVQLLLEHGAKISDNGDADGATLLDDDGGTLLHWAAVEDDHEKGDAIALLLLQHGADVSARNYEQRTALHQASMHGHAAVAQVLLDNGADVSSTDQMGFTALHLGTSQQHVDVVRLLIAHRANVLARAHSVVEDGVTLNGVTPVDSAILASLESQRPIPHEVIAMIMAEAVSRAKCLAFAMGHHERLGAGSMMEGLEPEVLRQVLEVHTTF